MLWIQSPAAGVVVGVEAVLLVAHREAAGDDVAGDFTREAGAGLDAVAAGLEAVAVGEGFELRGEAVVEGPAILETDRGVGGDGIVSVIGIEPGAAAAEDVAGFMVAEGMTAEAIDVAPAPVPRDRVMVVPGVAVEDEVVAAAGEVEADTHAVVHAELLVGVVAAGVGEADGLGVAGGSDLHADHLDVLEVEVGAGDLKGVDPVCRGA